MTRLFSPRLIALAASALLAACSSMAPKYERPAAPVAATWPMDATTEGTPLAADIDWQNFFPDPRFRELIAIALQGNRDLRVAVLQIEQARAQYQIRRADRYPTLSAQLTGNRASASNTGNLYTAGIVTQNWEIDFFGRIASLSDAALA